MRRTLLPQLLLSLTGCSYAFVQAPPEDHAQLSYVDCTDSRVAPIVDVIGSLNWASTALFINALAAASVARDEVDDNSEARTAVTILLLAAAAAQGASAVYGFQTTSECDSAKEQWHLRMLGPAPAAIGCASDHECKGDRICVDGICHAPPN